MDSPLSTRAIILAVLSDGVPQHGFGIIERVREQTGGRVDLYQGSVYPALESLLRSRYVRRVSGPGRGRSVELTLRGEKLVAEHREIIASLYGFSVDATVETSMKETTFHDIDDDVS